MSHDTKGEMADHDRVIRSEERLCQIDTQWVAHATVHELEQRALRLQHEEYERRLDDLNHENARVAANTAQFASRESVEGSVRELTSRIESNAQLLAGMTPREVYESTQREVQQRAEALANTVTAKPSKEEHNSLADRTKALEDWKNKATGAAVILTLVSGAVGAVIAKALGG